MSKKGWRIINAVETAVNGHPEPHDSPLTPEEIEFARECRLLEEYDRQKRVPKPSQDFGANVGSLLLSALSKDSLFKALSKK